MVRTPVGAFSRDAVRGRTSAFVPSVLPKTAWHLESNDDVVCKAHDNDITVCLFSTPRLNPQVKYVVQVDVGQQRRCTAALGCTFFHSYPLPILQHAGIQPFLDEPHNASVRNSMLDELHQPSV